MHALPQALPPPPKKLLTNTKPLHSTPHVLRPLREDRNKPQGREKCCIYKGREGLAGAGLPAQAGGAAGTLAAAVELYGSEVAAAIPGALAAALGLPAPEAPWHTRRTAVTRLGDALIDVLKRTVVPLREPIAELKTRVLELEAAAAAREEVSHHADR